MSDDKKISWEEAEKFALETYERMREEERRAFLNDPDIAIPEGHEELNVPAIGWYCKHPRCLWPETSHFDSLKTAMEHFSDDQKVAFMELENELRKAILSLYNYNSISCDSLIQFSNLSKEYPKKR